MYQTVPSLLKTRTYLRGKNIGAGQFGTGTSTGRRMFLLFKRISVL